MEKKNEGKEAPSIFSYVAHLLFILAQIYCGIFVIILLIPPFYAIVKCYKPDDDKKIFVTHDIKDKNLIFKLKTNKIIEKNHYFPNQLNFSKHIKNENHLNQLIRQEYPNFDGRYIAKDEFTEKNIDYDQLIEKEIITKIIKTNKGKNNWFYFNPKTQENLEYNLIKNKIDPKPIIDILSKSNSLQQINQLWHRSHYLEFEMLLNVFPEWWLKLKKLSTVQFFLLLIASYPIGFVFAELFYRLATLTVMPIKKYRIGKRDFNNNDDLINKLIDLKIIQEPFMDKIIKMAKNLPILKIRGQKEINTNKEDCYVFNYFHSLIKNEIEFKKKLWSPSNRVSFIEKDLIEYINRETIQLLITENILIKEKNDKYHFNDKITSKNILKNRLIDLFYKKIFPFWQQNYPIPDYIIKNNELNKLIDKKILTKDDQNNYRFNKDIISNKKLLKNRLAFLTTNIVRFWCKKAYLIEKEIDQTIDVWNKSLRQTYPRKIPIFISPFQYMKDINLDNPHDLYKETTVGNSSVKESEQKKQFQTLYEIQKNLHFLRIWEWEQFQFNFCLYLEGIFLVFTILFACSMVLTIRFISPTNWIFITIALSILLLIILFILSEEGIILNLLLLTIFILTTGITLHKITISGDTFCIGTCFAILLFSTFLTSLMRRGRKLKATAFYSAHQVIKGLLNQEKEVSDHGGQ